MISKSSCQTIRDTLFRCVVGIGTALCCASAGAAGIYGYTDDAGVTVLSNVPDRNDYRLIMRLPDEQRLRTDRSGAKRGDPRVPTPFQTEIATAASTFGVEPALLHAVITVESNHNPAARSPKGAMGLMQLMPETSRRFGVTDPWHPEQNIRGGAQYLSELLAMFDNDLPLALAAYNAGEQAVMRHGRRIPPYAETRGYVTRVMALYDRQTGEKTTTTRKPAARAM
jgi:hypothetical protein